MCLNFLVSSLMLTSTMSSSFHVVLDLRGEEVRNVADVFDDVLHHDRQIAAQTKHDLVAQRRRLGERVQVSKRKGQVDRLGELNGDHVVLLLRGVLAAHDVRITDVTRGGKLDAVLGHVDGHRVPDGRQVSANALELDRRHSDGHRVVRLRDTQMFTVNVHELQFEVRNLFLACVVPSPSVLRSRSSLASRRRHNRAHRVTHPETQT